MSENETRDPDSTLEEEDGLELARKMGAVAVLMVENSPEQNKDVADGIVSSRKVSDERPIFPGECGRGDGGDAESGCGNAPGGPVQTRYPGTD